MSLFAYFSLTTPAMLAGLGLLALPIIAHLLNRHSRRKVVFPTIRLLKQSVASQSRLFRLRRWILLAIRCLLVALLVAAFARPVWHDAAAGSSTADKTNCVVIVLDVSASTGQLTGGVNTYQSLRSRAIRILDELSSGTDYAGIVVAASRPTFILPKLTRNLQALRDELGRLNSTPERADLPQALRLAGELLKDQSGARQILILSDLQQSNWDDVLQRSDYAGLWPAGTRVTVLDPAGSQTPNIGLSHPRHFPSQPLAGQPLQLLVRASNYSEAPQQMRATLSVDGVPSGEQTVTLAAGEQRDVAFDSGTSAPGEHLVEFSIPEDSLAVDDRAFLVYNTVNKLPVLIISDDDSTEVGSATYFLLRALAPHNDIHDRFAARHLRLAQITAEDLARSVAVFIGYLSEMNSTAAGMLRAYVEQGGGLMIFSGEGAVIRNLQALEAGAPDRPLLPWLTGPARIAGLTQEPLQITAGKWQSRLLSDFDEQSQMSIAQIRFQRTWTAGAVRPDAQVLLTFSDGTPAMGLQQNGLGQVVLANFSPALQTSDLAKYGSFVALVQSLATRLKPATSSTIPQFAGEVVRYSETMGAENRAGSVSLLGPPQRRELPLSTTAEGSSLSVEHRRSEQPGFYEFHRAQTRLKTVAINVDPRESDLRRIAPAILTKHLGLDGSPVELQGTKGWDQTIAHRGQPVWGTCIAVAMCLAALELLLVGWWRR